jgi:heme/copper-type cytochrome/quinol oxidase subunit 2
MNRERAIGTLGTLGAVALLGIPARSGAEPSPHAVIRILGPQHKRTGPDRLAHAAFVPSEIEVPVNELVTVSVVSDDLEMHSITAPGLDVDQKIAPAIKRAGKIVPVTTTFTFTAYGSGVYRWYCRYACDMGTRMWSMGTGYTGRGKEGFMAGRIIVV